MDKGLQKTQVSPQTRKPWSWDTSQEDAPMPEAVTDEAEEHMPFKSARTQMNLGCYLCGLDKQA